MKNLKRLPDVLEFQWNWSKGIYDAYLDIYEEILTSDYKHPQARSFIDTKIHPSNISEDGYYRFIHEEDEEFWYVKNGRPLHKTTFWLGDKRPKMSHAYSNTDLKQLNSEGAKFIKNDCEKLCAYYDIQDYNLRLMTMKQNDYLTWHKDSKKTKAAINYNFGTEGTVDFFSASYTYKTALLNIQEYHAVVNNDKDDRITLKITSRDVEYDELYKRITG